MNMMRSRTEAVTMTASLTAVGLILSYLETFIVIPVNVPGIRLGLANIVTLLALYLLGPSYAFPVTIIRVSLAAMLFGSPVSFMYSIAGGIFSFAGMVISKRLGFSVYGVSVIGAVAHNIAQTVVAVLFIANVYIFAVLPVLVIAGIIAGLLTGLCASVLMKRLVSILHIGDKKER